MCCKLQMKGSINQSSVVIRYLSHSLLRISSAVVLLRHKRPSQQILLQNSQRARRCRSFDVAPSHLLARRLRSLAGIRFVDVTWKPSQTEASFPRHCSTCHHLSCPPFSWSEYEVIHDKIYHHDESHNFSHILHLFSF